MSRSETFLVLILLCVCLTLFFFRLGTRPLWDRDEGIHAVTSKEMVLSGDWVTTTFNGQNFYDKPVLYNWLAALSFVVFGFTEFAARLPAATLGLGCVVVTYLLGRRMFDPVAGFLGGMILATSFLFIILSRAVVHDISLVFSVTLALFFFYWGFTCERHRKTYFLLFYASSGFAVLAKGPMGILLPALIIGLFLILKGKLRFLREMQIGWGVLVFLVVAAPWYVLISLRNSDYAGYFFIEQNLTRFFSIDAHHARPFLYYVPILLGAFSPWSFFLPLAFIHALRDGWKRASEGSLFLMLWFGVVFLFFSVASSKGGTYILPLFPAASLLVGIFWRELFYAPTPWLRKGFLYSFLPLVAILPLGVLYVLINPPAIVEARYGINLGQMKFIGFLLVGLLAFSFFMLLRGYYRVFFAGNVGLVASGALLFFVLVAPLMNPHQSSKALARKLDVIVPPGETLVFFDTMWDSALFYTTRRAVFLQDRSELIGYFMSNKRAFVVIDKKHFEEFAVLKEISYVVDKEGRNLIISRKPLISLDDQGRIMIPKGDPGSD